MKFEIVRYMARDGRWEHEVLPEKFKSITKAARHAQNYYDAEPLSDVLYQSSNCRRYFIQIAE